MNTLLGHPAIVVVSVDVLDEDDVLVEDDVLDEDDELDEDPSSGRWQRSTKRPNGSVNMTAFAAAYP